MKKKKHICVTCGTEYKIPNILSDNGNCIVCCKASLDARGWGRKIRSVKRVLARTIKNPQQVLGTCKNCGRTNTVIELMTELCIRNCYEPTDLRGVK